MSDVSKVIDGLLSEADKHDARSIKIREAVEAIRAVSLISAVEAPKRGRPPSRVFHSAGLSGVMVKDIPVKASKKKGKKRKYTKRSTFWKKKK